MQITRVRVREVSGSLPSQGQFWEERQARAIDVYPEYRDQARPEFQGQAAGQPVPLTAWFVQIETDDGAFGIGGPIRLPQARLLLQQLRPLLIGKDPLATECLWDQMHRWQVHGRQGEAMLALSAVDCALWDLKARVMNVPLYKLLGGPTRREVPAYASMLGYAVLDLGLVRERAQMVQAEGYTAQKWFFRHGAMSGAEGLKANVALVRTLREAVGDDHDIMLDCWQSMSLDYAVDLCSRIEEYRPRWIEEALRVDRVDSYARLKERTRIPLAGAEHEYTRWGFKRFIGQGALDVLQPDIYWCGGLSEALKIGAYASVHDLTVIPHGHPTPINTHFTCAQSPIHTPYQEYLIKWNEVHQHFLKTPLKPVNGTIHLPDTPGIGMDLDPAKIEREVELDG